MSFKYYTLPNNLRVLEYYIPHVESVAIRVDIRNGAVFENDKNAGISHLLEHWVHQGNEKYPDFTTFITNLEKQGIYQNGVTQKFQSYYYVKAPREKLKESFEDLFYLVAKPTFPLHREQHVKEVVLNEYYDQYRTPEAKFWREIILRRFTDKPVVVNDTIGTPETINAITPDEVKKWFKKYYHSSNMLLTIVGNFDSIELKKLIDSTYKKLPRSKKITFPEVAPGNYSSFSIFNYPEKRDQLEFVISFPTLGWKGNLRKMKMISFIETALAGGGFSRLFRILREEHHLVYRVGTTGVGYPSRGTVDIAGLTQRKNIKSVMRIIKDEIDKLKEGSITEDELETAKNISISSTIFEGERPEGIGSHFIEYAFWDEKIKTIDDDIEEAKGIKLAEVNKLAKTLFDFKKVNISILGTLTKSEIASIEKIFKS